MPPEGATLTREDVLDVVGEVFQGFRDRMDGARGSRLVGLRHNAPGSPQTSGYGHGPGGVFSYPGVDTDVYTSFIGTLPGLLNELPTRPSRFVNQTYEVLTGQYGDSGSERDAICDPSPTPGLVKAGIIWAPFGKYSRSTPELVVGRMGQFNDLADPMDLRLVGGPIAESPWPDVIGPQATQDMLINELRLALFRRAVSMHRLLTRQIWEGNPQNNTGEGYQEMAGLELLVTTGYVDAITNAALPSVDSDVKDLAYANVSVDGGPDLVEAVTYLFRYLRSIAMRTGMDPVRWQIAMREELFYEVTAAWPCSYLTTRCVLPEQATQFVDARGQIEFRDRLRREQILVIDGIDVEVVFDDGIPEQNGNNSGGHFGAGTFASDIYFIPMAAQGRALTFIDYFQYDNAAIQQASQLLSNLVRVRAAGAFLEYVSQTRQCFTSEIEISPRVVLRTPWLAGRLKNVAYTPLQHTRQPFPDDPYFVNGGGTSRPGPSYYAGWKN